jgi:hypothetical protein
MRTTKAHTAKDKRQGVTRLPGRLARRRQVSFAVRERDYDGVTQAKRRFGSLAVARFVAVLLREVGRLARGADRR